MTAELIRPRKAPFSWRVLREIRRFLKRLGIPVPKPNRWANAKNGPDALTISNPRDLITFAYETLLWRHPAETEYQNWEEQFRSGTGPIDFLHAVRASPEANNRQQGADLYSSLSDGEFVVRAAVALLGRGALPAEVELWKRYLNEDRGRRDEFVRNRLGVRIGEQQASASSSVPVNDPERCWIMGTDKVFDRETWNERARELGLTSPGPGKRELPHAGFRHTGSYVVSAIASLYKGGRYIEGFLENITSQTLFDRSELIVIDADSPDGESEVIGEYQKRFPNIIYKRVNHRITVYAAWNLAVELSRGRYITNTNVDDIRRRDSFEIQAFNLDRYPWADVVYQDFYYSFDATLSFEEVARFGFRSSLPIVTPHNLLAFNSPHNAPMWRRQLHPEVGDFDESYQSAGDYEFWMRCMGKGKNFFKTNDPHVVYYNNPDGLSTKPDTKGVVEAHRLLARHGRDLVSKRLTLSRADFAALVGAGPEELVGRPDATYYDIAHAQLVRAGAAYKAQQNH